MGGSRPNGPQRNIGAWARHLHRGAPRRCGPSLPANRGIVVRGRDRYLRQHAAYLINAYEERRSPGGPPRWSPDGGRDAHTFITPNLPPGDVSKEPATGDVLTPEELSDVLAEATETTADEIEREAEEPDIAPPEEATVVEPADE